MADEKETAPAASKGVSKKKSTGLIPGVSLTRIHHDGHSPPCALYDGTAPEKGDRISFKLANGVTYTGVVADATEADGNVLVEFVDGIKPVSPK
ncbi:hypothetical protein JQX09_17590 [Sulfitobacter pseudonitzschiae]|uniref:Uncharacterized protein n=1 Tax=Pseudosulfitobacter pseudonitzschiae TaxID=1402135 RepID=A0A9Q2NKI9_9RHOB|nr:hypothetical protein [Pseudosulfitobacter pseudonitzschiae]MBM2293745.1 hypothetical protein [Pseudosulfitobacter pseudonitzschiae]MBM2298663.1 hypothetical protein [Pseudosulfitobacter pseudonitzschiae]MBM2303577.1 hypothetical protein [Pseudosulfitobacter pseudonitzschiae]MBM2313360.1 hypothetical protein [Pseudosulfitobacter pseudonitzschiae]MBM2318273.1 hypothetical protein [Pseudosulfitobacter pseudonitzschiae]